ncbi:hypothetical protein LLG96_15430 [bacterium]|nr:hypothetical protein [bacterium]
MREIIEDIRAKLRSNAYKNREHIRLSLVVRILSQSGWDVWNPSEVCPDFITGAKSDETHADLALFAAPPVPSVFFDIVAPGSAVTDLTRFERFFQDYPSDNIPLFFIITDGRYWKLYFSRTSESFPDASFKTLDMLDDSADDLESAFSDYLQKSAIADGSAYEKVSNYLRHNTISDAVREVIPAARILVTEPPFPRLPEAIIQLLIQKGLETTENDVLTILRENESPKVMHESKPSPATQPNQPEPPEAPKPVSHPPYPPPQEIKDSPVKTAKITDYSYKKIKSFIFRGQTYYPKSWKEMLITYCEIVYQLNTNDFYNCLKLKINDQRCFSKNIKDFFGKAPVQIGESDFYVMTDLTANHIVLVVYNLMKLFGYKKEDIEIIIE